VFDEHGEEPFPIRNILAADSPLATPVRLLADTYRCCPGTRFGPPLWTLLTDSGPVRECYYRLKQLHWLASLRARMLTKT
jgi:hypothetical protein